MYQRILKPSISLSVTGAVVSDSSDSLLSLLASIPVVSGSGVPAEASDVVSAQTSVSGGLYADDVSPLSRRYGTTTRRVRYASSALTRDAKFAQDTVNTVRIISITTVSIRDMRKAVRSL